jgi:AcrR family transcriptional regulator
MADKLPANARRWPVQKRSRDRLERVLRVAEGLIVERGFANLNMKELAEIANVNISTIYAYFPNSQSLLRVLAVRYIEDSERRAKELYGRVSDLDSPAEKMIDEILDVVIEFYQTNPNWNAIWRGMQSDNELMGMDIEDTRINSSLLGSLLTKINPNLGDDIHLTAMILTVINGAVIRLASELSVREREAIYQQLRQLVRRMLIF